MKRALEKAGKHSRVRSRQDYEGHGFYNGGEQRASSTRRCSRSSRSTSARASAGEGPTAALTALVPPPLLRRGGLGRAYPLLQSGVDRLARRPLPRQSGSAAAKPA